MIVLVVSNNEDCMRWNFKALCRVRRVFALTDSVNSGIRNPYKLDTANLFLKSFS